MLALLAATPVFAQSAPPATTTTSTSSTTSSTTTSSTSTTSTTVPATTTTDAPPPAAVPAKTSNPTPQPGENVPISAPQQNNTPVLDNTKPSAAVMLPADGGADIPMPQPKIPQNAHGSITVEVTVPPSTPPGVYLIAIVGTDSKGVSRAIIVPVVVRRTRTAAALSAPIVAASAPTAVVPKGVRQIVASIADIDGGSAAVEDAVLHDGATLDISGSQLVVNRPGDGSDSRPLVAAFAVALAGGGLVLLRRRTPATSRRNR
ncbi:MAG: hypothetical protein JWN67_457 [Actinomycetia bacterium]|nr:hypothetical protein [Actinomycetes bacterium]